MNADSTESLGHPNSESGILLHPLILELGAKCDPKIKNLFTSQINPWCPNGYIPHWPKFHPIPF
jgi:hypothetical protein